MKKFNLLLIGAILSMSILSCGGGEKDAEIDEANVSSEGNWNEDDKNKAQDAADGMRAQLEESMSSDQVDEYIDCYLEKVEDNFPDFNTANNDLEGCTKLAIECRDAVADNTGSTYGAWDAENIAKAKVELGKVRSEMESMLGDNTDAFYDCYLDALEENYPDFDTANLDFAGCNELATACMENYK